MLCDYEKALESFLKGLEATEKDRAQLTAQKKSIERTLRNEVRLLSNISNIYSSLFNVDKSIEYLLRAVKIMENNPDVHFKEKYATLGNLGDRYLYIGDLEKALPLLEESYQLAADNEDLRLMVYGLLRLAAYNKRIANLMQAIDYEKQALQIAEQINQPVLLNEVDKGLMQSYTPIEEYKLSIYHGERVLERTDEEEWKSLEIVYRNMALNYAALGDIEKAYDYMHKYQLSFLKIADETMHSALQEMEVKYDVQQKELQISNQQLEIKQHQTRQYLFISGLILAGLLVTMLVIIVMMRTRRNRILAEMNAVKDKFFSIISHDLKNPAAAQRDALQLLVNDADQLDKNTLTNYYQELFKSANSLVELLKNLLNWAQLQTKREFYQPASFDLVDAIQPDINVIKSMAEHKNITFEALLPPDALIMADENMMITVIRNLLANAVKFTSAGGTVTLEVEKMEKAEGKKQKAEGKKQKGYIVSVSDTGIGMSAVETQCIASLQTRSKPGTAGEQGTGLGLIVCKEMLEKNGSKLNVESEEGKGSKFWFTV